MAFDPVDPKKRSGVRPLQNNGDPRIADILGAIASVISERGLERETLDAITARVGQASKLAPQQSDEQSTKDKNKPQDQKKDKDDNSKQDKEDDGKEAEDKPMPPEKKRRLIIIGVVVGVLVLLGVIFYWLHARQYETTDDAFIDGHISQISAQASGRIISLLVDDNQKVETGQLLAEIDPRDYLVRLAQSRAQYKQAVAQLAQQKANYGQARANVVMAEADAVQADRDLQRYREVDPQAITQQQRDTAIATATSNRAKLEASRQAADAAKAQIETAQASLQQAQSDVDNAELQLSYTKITAPVAGKITRRTVEVGNVVAPGPPLLAVVPNDLWVTANFKETQLDLMKVGQHVRIRIDAYPNADLGAHIDSFQRGSGSAFSTLPAENATGNYVKVVQRVPVKIVFDNPQQSEQFQLAPGLSVSPRVTVR